MVDKKVNILEYTNTNYAIEQFQLKYFCSFFLHPPFGGISGAVSYCALFFARSLTPSP